MNDIHENNETIITKKRENRNITLTVHDGVIGKQSKFNFKQIIHNMMNEFSRKKEKINGSNDV